MGKKLVFIVVFSILIIVFSFLGYMFGFLYSKQTDELDLSREIYAKAQFEYKSSDYINTIKYLEVANDIYKDYDVSIDSVKKIRNLNSLIEKNTSDYKLYVERGDVQSIKSVEELGKEGSITSNYCFAIDDYSKALKLNNNASEVYHKRAKAYINCKKSVDYKQNIITDYEKTLSFTEDKDGILEEIADWLLYDIDDAPSALRYYSKIQEFDIDKAELQKNKLPFSVENIKYVPFKKILCYEKIKDYDAILNLLNEIVDETDNNAVFQKANNLIFYYNLKSYKVSEAIHSAKQCSAMICKAINFLNFKERD
ncbi:MAG: hypothetical protein IKU37_02790 [Candidatus Gastranaerophilales bacterium]|nr:hypothetical protein [Candidatus Gastranaerophilales bacterium]